VDDGSSDASVITAGAFADTVIRLPAAVSGRRLGAPYSRNRGFEMSRAEVVVFVDPDIEVAKDALRRIWELLNADSDIGAIAGLLSEPPHDAAPIRKIAVLRLLHDHEAVAGETDAFFLRFGAIRSSLLSELELFNEWQADYPMAETIEVAERIRLFGYRVMLHSEIRANCLRPWTFGGLIADALRDAGTPWTSSQVADRKPHLPAIASHRYRQRLSEFSAWTVLGCGLIVAVSPEIMLRWRHWLFAGSVVGLILLRIDFYRRVARSQGRSLAIPAAVVDALALLASGLARVRASLVRGIVGAPRPDATTEAFTEVGVETWPPIPAKRYPPAQRSSVATS
jgi:glycosyltransferase involved in cell wall biosynthesis